MKLKKISYSEYAAASQEWVLEDLDLGPINLLVGRNATGKTRCLNVINSLSKLLSGEIQQLFDSASYDALFENDQGQLRYILEIKNQRVLEESFSIDGKNLMMRGQGGAGEIYAEEVKRRIKFQAPETSLAAVARQDEIQHSFLACLNDWSKRVIHYGFGSPLGKDHFVLLRKDMKEQFDPRKTDQVIAIFLKGKKTFEESYINAVLNDMKRVQYNIELIDVKKPKGVAFPVNVGGDPVGLYVKEADLPGITEQINISQGMFRALSLIIQINYCQMAALPLCIIIDDIGEGLDYERSVSLINLLVEKAQQSPVQLIMSTNDKFVMNSVPLEAWCVLKREGNKCRVYNYGNSKEKFDDFKFTGMNNFDFLASDYLEEGLPEDE